MVNMPPFSVIDLQGKASESHIYVLIHQISPFVDNWNLRKKIESEVKFRWYITLSLCVYVCVCVCARVRVRVRPFTVKASSAWNSWTAREQINDIALETFTFYAKYLHCYFRMKHLTFLTNHFILFTL